ncbi:MAG: hypothetical protein JNK87_42860 [Bryobacterales bacterium]|nr:hypothetical protein [Bryobacterales bacterium]
MNTISITQRAEQTKLAMEVHQHATIARVRMTRAKLTAELEDEAGPEPAVGVRFQFRSKPLPAPEGTLRIEVSFQMIGVAEGEGAEEERKADPAVLVDCAFAADYELAADFAIRPEHVKAFKDGNAIFNVWPYFREFLQSSLQRMGLPPLTAPFLRLEVKREGGPVKERARKAGASVSPD